MSPHYNALIVVLGITLIVFHLAKPLVVNFMAVEDFARRRNIWLGLVVAAFVVSNYWLYVLVAIGLLTYGLKRDSNPAALYLFLLLAIPPFASDIPTFGLITQLFPLDHLRLLSLVILLPAAVGLFRATSAPDTTLLRVGSNRQGLLPTDVLILLYCALQFALWLPYDSPIASIRRAFLLCIDILLPYFVLSRACQTREMIVDVMASFALAATALACLAVFENVRAWLLFSSLEESWGSLGLTSYLRRGNALRAQVTAGHSIVLGYALAVALGFWLYLQNKLVATRLRWLALLSLLAGLAATLARGPWLGALVMVLLYLSLGPKAISRLLKVLSVLTVAAGLLLASPWGTDFVDRLPFIGTSDQDGSVVYRQRIAAASWQLIQQNPLFGNLAAGESMEDLRQGEGIIDMVNTYAYIALAFGLVGLSLFAGFFGVIVVNCARAIRRSAAADTDLSLLGSGLLASVVGGLLIIATVGLYLSIGYLIWAVAGLAVAYAQLARTKAAQEAHPRGTYDQPGGRTNPPEWRT